MSRKANGFFFLGEKQIVTGQKTCKSGPLLCFIFPSREIHTINKMFAHYNTPSECRMDITKITVRAKVVPPRIATFCTL